MCFHPWEVLWVLEGDGKLGAKEGNVLSSAPQGGRGPQRGRGGSGGGLGGGKGGGREEADKQKERVDTGPVM